MKSLVDKYHPMVLDDLLLGEDVKRVISDFLEQRNIPSLLLSGKQGIGKSTLANIIVRSLDATHLYINCGLDGNVDTMRTKVREFCDSVAINNDVPKIVILDEADALSSTGEGSGGKSSAQGALRNLIDQSSDDTRFILTCNYLSRIIEPIQSRCTPVQLSTTIDDVIKLCIMILKKEGISFKRDSLKQFIKNVIKSKFPDIRAIINLLEQWVVSGTLTPVQITNSIELDDVVYRIFELLINESPMKAREWYLNNEDKFNNDYHKLTVAIFNNLMGQNDKQLIVGKSLRHQAYVLDKEIEFFTMLMEIKGII